GAEKISFEFRSVFGDKIAGFPVLSCAKGWHCWRDRRLAGRERPDGGIRLCVSWSFRGRFRECAGSPLGRSAALVMAVGLQKFAQKTAPPADPAGGGVKTGLELAGVVLDLDGYKQQVVQECADALGLVL